MRNEELIFGLINLIGVIKNKKNVCPQKDKHFSIFADVAGHVPTA